MPDSMTQATAMPDDLITVNLSEREVQVLRGLNIAGPCYISASEAGDPALHRLLNEPIGEARLVHVSLSLYGRMDRWQLTDAGRLALTLHDAKAAADLAALRDEEG